MEFRIDVPDDAWQAVGPDEDALSLDWGDEPPKGLDKRSYLLATLHINGVPHHLEAVEVRQEEVQAPVDPDRNDTLDGLWQAGNIDGRADTMTIAGREYIVFATPFS